MKYKIILILAVTAFFQNQIHGQEKKITLTFVGDIMAHSVNYILTDYSVIYNSIQDILKKDFLTFGNLETPVDSSREYSTYPRFNILPEYAEAAVRAGIDVLSLANNHAFDHGRDSLFQTLRSLAIIEKKVCRKVYYSGIRGNLKADFKPIEIHKRGLKIGFLAVTQMVNQFQKFPFVNIVDYENGRHKREFLPYIREITGSYDLFILSYHGGREYALKPDPEKVRFFHQLLDAGVDIVYAHHPHVLQPFHLISIEGRTKLILLSTGNFISGMTWGIDPADPHNILAYTGDSALWIVEVLCTGHSASVETVRPVLITNYKNRKGEMVIESFSNLALLDLSEEWAEYYQARHKIISDLVKK